MRSLVTLRCAWDTVCGLHVSRPFSSRAGASMIGELDRSGIGEPVEVDHVNSVAELYAGCARSNDVLLRQLKEDTHALPLWEATCKDANLGRLSHPAAVADCEWDRVLLHPRFAVSQVKPDGSTKLRAVDHLSWSAGRHKADSVNGCTAPSEKMKHDTLDALAIGMSVFVDTVREVPGLFKADVDSAYRRVPIRPEHRWACGVAFRVKEQVSFSFSSHDRV